jgi:outer membrane protein OmpA-like peptidoglycan-associated protein
MQQAAVTGLVWLWCFLTAFAATAQPQRKITVYFETAKATLTTPEQERFSAFLEKAGGYRFLEIKAYTDTVGGKAYNDVLSQQRAATIKGLMLQRQPNAVVRLVQGLGESVTGSTDSLNRRAELTLYKDSASFSASKTIKLLVLDAKTQQLVNPVTVRLYYKAGERKFDVPGRYVFQANSDKALPLQILFESRNYTDTLLDMKKLLLSGKRSGDTITAMIPMQPRNLLARIDLDNLYFLDDDSVLAEKSYSSLYELLGKVKQYKGKTIEITGHVNFPYYLGPMDDHTARYMQILSEGRARTIARYLEEKGIPAQTIRCKGMSNRKMVFPNGHSLSEQRSNMRVEVVVIQE